MRWMARASGSISSTTRGASPIWRSGGRRCGQSRSGSLGTLCCPPHGEELNVPHSKYLSSIEEIIDDCRNGRMFILVDDESRENEGDLVIPAQMATPDAINFMAKYGRGLICLSLPHE